MIAYGTYLFLQNTGGLLLASWYPSVHFTPYLKPPLYIASLGKIKTTEKRLAAGNVIPR